MNESHYSLMLSLESSHISSIHRFVSDPLCFALYTSPFDHICYYIVCNSTSFIPHNLFINLHYTRETHILKDWLAQDLFSTISFINLHCIMETHILKDWLAQQLPEVISSGPSQCHKFTNCHINRYYRELSPVTYVKIHHSIKSNRCVSFTWP